MWKICQKKEFSSISHKLYTEICWACFTSKSNEEIPENHEEGSKNTSGDLTKTIEAEVGNLLHKPGEPPNDSWDLTNKMLDLQCSPTKIGAVWVNTKVK